MNGNYRKKIIINILIVVILQFIIKYEVPLRIRNRDMQIAMESYMWMTEKGDVAYRVNGKELDADNQSYEYVLQQYENQYMLHEIPEMRKLFQGGIYPIELSFDNSMSIVSLGKDEPSRYDYSYNCSHILAIAENDSIDSIKIQKYDEEGNICSGLIEIDRYKDTNIFIGDLREIGGAIYDSQIEGTGYHHNITGYAYDSKGNQISVSKCRVQKMAEYRERQVSE